MEGTNYSKQSGEDLIELDNHKLSLIYSKNKICLQCNSEINEYSSYCNYCGKSNSEINKSVKREKKTLIEKEGIIIGGASIVTLLIMAMIIKLIISIGLGGIGSVINPSQIMMFLNLSPVSIYSASMLGSGVIRAQIGVIGILIIPAMAIFIANKMFMKNKSPKSVVGRILGVGITYGLLMVIIGSLLPVRTSFRDLLGYDSNIIFRYNILGTFFNGFIISAVCTYIIGFKNKYKEDNLYLNIFDKVIKTIGVGYIFTIIILIIVTISDRSYLSEIGLYAYHDKISIVGILSQLALYIWAFSNFVPITIGENTLFSLDILSSELFLETKLIFIAMIAVSLLVLLITGFRLKENYNKSDIKPVIIFSLFYSLSMGVLSIFSEIAIGGSMSFFGAESFNGSISMGFPLFITLISSFLYSFLVTLLGYKLNI